ncbi:hypothetical protein [Polaromonas hydrogenivorans]|uniref:Uncharacterized protein n=1 Tax=Polaromonas hydrogenivorans TaxID=335476 RepID=A0AAU7LWG9_9BURK
MTLRNQFIDAIIDGKFGNGITVTRQEFMQFFSNENSLTTGCFLSNSEIITGAPHSPNYTHFTLRISEGRYRVHPGAIEIRMQQRGML